MSDYLTGFGNSFASEAVAGALPVGRNSPQRPPFGLYAEQLSGTAFTAPRHENRRSWLYRLRPSASHSAYVPYASGFDAAGNEEPLAPNRLRWSRPEPTSGADFIDGLRPMLGNGSAERLEGCGVHLYAADRSMERRVMFSADGELLIVPQAGAMEIRSETGKFEVGPGSIALIPRGIRFQIRLLDGPVSGYVAENYGSLFRLPELGPIGSNGLANARDFETPVAWYEDRDEPTEIVQKYGGRLWSTTIDHSPLDVVAWHGNLVPYRYELARFNTIGTVSFDHPDPSIFTVLTSPSETVGRANCDFVIFPPRWMVAEDTFRPPWFHRNLMSEAMGLIHGAYDAKAEGFEPGGLSLHNRMSAHGPDLDSWRGASEAALQPHKIEGTMAFMIESALPFVPTAAALASAQPDYDGAWSAFPKAVIPR